jgi:hypothetical protein
MLYSRLGCEALNCDDYPTPVIIFLVSLPSWYLFLSYYKYEHYPIIQSGVKFIYPIGHNTEMAPMLSTPRLRR